MLQLFKNGSLFDGDFFESMYGDLYSAGARSAAISSIPVDIHEYEGHYELALDAPGIPEKDIMVEFKDRVLTVELKRLRDKDEARKTHKTERYSGTFRRTFSVEATIDSDNIRAKAKDGVLTISLPKTAEAQPRKIQIN